MTDQYGPTTRVNTPDGNVPGETSPMPGGSNMVFASDANIAAAEDLRAEQEGARAEAEKANSTIRTDGGVHRFTEHADGRVEQRQDRIIRSDSSPATTG